MTRAHPTRRPTQAERTAAMKQRLIDAAISSLIENGYAHTTSVEVCRRAGVTRGALNHHFADLPALLIEVLERRCNGRNGACSRPGGGRHVLCSGRIAREAAVYPPGLCKAVLTGIAAQLRSDNKLRPGCFGIQAVDEEAEVHKSM